MWKPGGFYKGNKARERVWETASGKADFTVPTAHSAVGFDDAAGRYRLITMRSNDQFNTTIYGMSDRLRGIEGTRQVLLMNPREIARAGLKGRTGGIARRRRGGRRRPGGGARSRSRRSSFRTGASGDTTPK